MKNNKNISIYSELNNLSDVLSLAINNNDVLNHKIEFERFRHLIDSLSDEEGGIILQSHRALLYLIEGDSKKVCIYKFKEIEQIVQLFSIGGPIGDVNYDFLQKRIAELKHYIDSQL